MEKLRSLQALRFVAAKMVVLNHTTLNMVGAAGVDIFFVISGFIITRVARGGSPGGFLRDRLTRVLPIYYLCSIPWVLAAASTHSLSVQKVVATLTLWPAFGDIVAPLLVVGWTLSFELLFYAAMALVLARPRAAWVLPSLYALALVLAFLTRIAAFRFVGNPIIIEFGFGVLIAQIQWRSRWFGAAALLASAAVFVWYAFFGSNGAHGLASPAALWDLSQPMRPMEWGVPAALAVWGALQFDPLTGRIWSGLSYLGDASYSIYLTHLVPVALMSTLLWPYQVAASLGLGVIVYRYVERPLLTACRRVWAPAR